MRKVLILLPFLALPVTAFGTDAVEAASSCVVVHEKGGEDGKTLITCFENVSLERGAFEAGVCQWTVGAKGAGSSEGSTRFVKSCPASYSAYCDRLVLAPDVTAPVKIFLYDQSAEVLERAKKQCLSGGGNWNTGGQATK